MCAALSLAVTKLSVAEGGRLCTVSAFTGADASGVAFGEDATSVGGGTIPPCAGCGVEACLSWMTSL
jgi:hypothetical protein